MHEGDLWVFGYGSLMWRPGFDVVERAPARLEGYHRSFCLASVHHRGSPERPGLVLGLDRGGSCDGVAYRVEAAKAASVRAYLRERELVNGVYREAFLPVTLHGPEHRRVSALAFIVERAHPSYAGRQALSRQAEMIRCARGLSGDNLDYLVNTVTLLRTLGIRERSLERLVALAGPHIAHLNHHARAGGLESPYAAGVRRALAGRPAHLPNASFRQLRRGDRRRFSYRLSIGGA